MASHRSFFLSPLTTLLLLLVEAVLGALLLHGEGAMARPLPSIIAEPPASLGAVAAPGPAAAALAAGQGGRPDRSEAGAEVILAGFAAAVIVVVFCYIRVTRERSGVGLGEKHESFGGF